MNGHVSHYKTAKISIRRVLEDECGGLMHDSNEGTERYISMDMVSNNGSWLSVGSY